MEIKNSHSKQEIHELKTQILDLNSKIIFLKGKNESLNTELKDKNSDREKLLKEKEKKLELEIEIGKLRNEIENKHNNSSFFTHNASFAAKNEQENENLREKIIGLEAILNEYNTKFKRIHSELEEEKKRKIEIQKKFNSLVENNSNKFFLRFICIKNKYINI